MQPPGASSLPPIPTTVIPAEAGIQTRYRHDSSREVSGYGFPPSRE